MKKNKRMSYSKGGGVIVSKNFKDVQTSLNHFQDNNRVSTKIKAQGPKTTVSINREQFGDDPASKKITVKRKIGKNFEVKLSKQDKNKSIGLQYTKRFK
tara:strand:- start:205 stop:501 length:297 start_codon:yes stop_codon:yes gene_type:complete